MGASWGFLLVALDDVDDNELQVDFPEQETSEEVSPSGRFLRRCRRRLRLCGGASNAPTPCVEGGCLLRYKCCCCCCCCNRTPKFWLRCASEKAKPN